MTMDKPQPKEQQLPVEEPPPYEEPPLEETQAKPFPPVPEPPSDAQRAEAPLRVLQSNRSIKEDFIVIQGDSKSSKPSDPLSDVFLSTTNSALSSKLWLQGAWDHIPLIDVGTTNNRINLVVYPSRDCQSYTMNARTTNASLNVWLHDSFHGILILSNDHELGGNIKRQSVRIPLEGPVGVPDAVGYRIGEKGGKSVVKLQTTNNSVKVEFS